MHKDSILVICAHNDDQIIGVGGTLAKYAKEGKEIHVVIFSYGEGSHPWLKDEAITQIRLKECAESDKILGITDTIYMGLGDAFKKHTQGARKLKKELVQIIEDKEPEKIFTHSRDDPHADHRAVNAFVYGLIDEGKITCDVFTFDIWNPINIRERDKPRLVVDTTDTYRLKLEALRCHKSQKMTIISLWWNVFRKDFFHGLANHTRFAEIFYKIR